MANLCSVCCRTKSTTTDFEKLEDEPSYLFFQFHEPSPALIRLLNLFPDNANVRPFRKELQKGKPTSLYQLGHLVTLAQISSNSLSHLVEDTSSVFTEFIDTNLAYINEAQIRASENTTYTLSLGDSQLANPIANSTASAMDNESNPSAPAQVNLNLNYQVGDDNPISPDTNHANALNQVAPVGTNQFLSFKDVSLHTTYDGTSGKQGLEDYLKQTRLFSWKYCPII